MTFLLYMLYIGPMKKISIFLAVVIFSAIPVLVFADTVPSVGDSSSSASPSVGGSTSSSAPSTGDSTSSASPSTGGSTSSADTVSTPSTGDSTSSAIPSVGGSASSAGPSSGSSGSSASPSVGGSTSSAGTFVDIGTPSVGGSSSSAGNISNNSNNSGSLNSTGTSNTSSGSSGGGFASSGSRSGFFSSGLGLNMVPNCPFLRSYMSLNSRNDSLEVSKLQSFLKISQKLDVEVTGVYNNQTFEAVKLFQQKYLVETMIPWGVNYPSGNVYITTLKKINEIACNTNMTLTSAELAIINSFRSKNQNSSNQNGVNGSDIGILNPVNNSSTSSPKIDSSNTNKNETGINDSDIIGQNGVNNANTAAVANISIFQKVWNFLKKIF